MASLMQGMGAQGKVCQFSILFYFLNSKNRKEYFLVLSPFEKGVSIFFIFPVSIPLFLLCSEGERRTFCFAKKIFMKFAKGERRGDKEKNDS